MNDFDVSICRLGKHSRANDVVTIRDYFAAKAMAGFLANPSQDYAPMSETKMDAVVVDSYCIADAMLAERSKP